MVSSNLYSVSLTRLVFLPLALGFCIVSCRTMATYQSVRNQAALDSVHTIGIAPYLMNEAAIAVYDSVFWALDTTLITNLRASGRFQRVVPWEALRLYVDEHASAVTPRLFDRAKQDHIDTLLFCKLEVLKSSYMFFPLEDAAVTLVVYEVNSRSVILSLRFSTQQRASHFVQPGIGQMTRDATAGAVEILFNEAKLPS